MNKLKIMATIFALTLALVSCGGGGSVAVGVATDNSKASGTYSYVSISGSSVSIGTVTLDGAGGGTETGLSPTISGPAALTYTSYTDNSITLDGTMQGNIRSGGNFIVLSNTNAGSETLVLMVKNSALAEPTATYRTGKFNYDSAASSDASIIDIDTQNPSAGNLAWSVVAPAVSSGTSGYMYNTLDGTYLINGTVNSDMAYGAISPDGQINIFGDGTTAFDTAVYAAMGLELPGAGMTNADLSGTYVLHQIMDEALATGPSYRTGRTRIVVDGAGNGTYTELASSTAGTLSSGAFTYTVSANGSFVVTGLAEGFVLADGSVMVLVDHNATDDNVDIQVGVRQ